VRRSSRTPLEPAWCGVLSRPHRRTGAYPELTPAVLERVHAYNKIDVAGTVVLANALGDLPERERRVWELDQRINQRGLGIDIEFVRAAKRIAEGSSKALLAEFAHHTGGLTPYQVAKTREWLKSQGYPLSNRAFPTTRRIASCAGCCRSGRSPRPR